MPRAVIDPGVLVAAAIAPRGTCGELLTACLDGQLQLVVSPALLSELAEVLARPKFRRYLTLDEAASFVSLIGQLAEHRRDPTLTAGATADPDDDYLVALAQSAGVDALVSGDRHLTQMKGSEPPVVEPAAMLTHLRSDAG